MLKEKKSRRDTVIALVCTAALLALVIVLENTMKPTGMLFTVLKKGAVYAVVASSMNLLNGFTGLFSLGQAGFMLLGAYTYAILTIPTADREAVYYLYNGSVINFSLPELLGGGAVGLVLGVLLALLLGGCAAALVAWLIGLPVLRLKSDYLAIATLGFAEIIRAVFQWDPLGPVTNGANALKNFPTFSSSSSTSARWAASSFRFSRNAAENTPLAARQCLAMSTLSKTVWLFHSRMFWNVRAMPAFVSLSGVGARTLW